MPGLVYAPHKWQLHRQRNSSQAEEGASKGPDETSKECELEATAPVNSSELKR